MTFPDIYYTHEMGQGYDIANYTVDNGTPSRARFLLEKFMRDGSFRTVIEKSMDGWILYMRENN